MGSLLDVLDDLLSLCISLHELRLDVILLGLSLFGDGLLLNLNSLVDLLDVGLGLLDGLLLKGIVLLGRDFDLLESLFQFGFFLLFGTFLSLQDSQELL